MRYSHIKSVAIFLTVAISRHGGGAQETHSSVPNVHFEMERDRNTLTQADAMGPSHVIEEDGLSDTNTTKTSSSSSPEQVNFNLTGIHNTTSTITSSPPSSKQMNSYQTGIDNENTTSTTDQPSSFPTESPAPSPSPTMTPTIAPSESTNPTLEPSTSTEPSSMPSQPPTELESAWPTESPAPSPSPTMTPTIAPSDSTSPSESPSISVKPSWMPSLSFAPTASPTTTYVIMSAKLDVKLPSTDEEMDKEEIEVFEEATEQFLIDNMCAVPDDIKKIEISSVKVFDQEVVTESRRLRRRRRRLRLLGLEPIDATYLKVKMDVIGYVYPGSPPEDFSFGNYTHCSFVRNFPGYLEELTEKLPGHYDYKFDSDPSAVVTEAAPLEPDKQKSIGAIIALSLAALFCLLIIIIIIWWFCCNSRNRDKENDDEASSDSLFKDEDKYSVSTKTESTKKEEDPRKSAMAISAPFQDVHKCTSATCLQCAEKNKVSFVAITPNVRRWLPNFSFAGTPRSAGSSVSTGRVAGGRKNGKSSATSLSSLTETIEPVRSTEIVSGSKGSENSVIKEEIEVLPVVPVCQVIPKENAADTEVKKDDNKVNSGKSGTPTKDDFKMPKGWEEAVDERTKKPYYFCRKTGERSWNRPRSDKKRKKKKLPSEWKISVDPKSGREYFYNTITNETKWTHPYE